MLVGAGNVGDARFSIDSGVIFNLLHSIHNGLFGCITYSVRFMYMQDVHRYDEENSKCDLKLSIKSGWSCMSD